MVYYLPPPPPCYHVTWCTFIFQVLGSVPWHMENSFHVAVRIEHTKRSDTEIARLVRELVFKMLVWCMSVPFIN